MLSWPVSPAASVSAHRFVVKPLAGSAGIYVYGYDASLNVKNSFPVFSTHIEANFVSKREDVYSLHALTDDDKAHVLELARDPRIGGCKQGGREGIACAVRSGLLGQGARAGAGQEPTHRGVQGVTGRVVHWLRGTSHAREAERGHRG